MTRFYKQANFTLARANPSTRVLLTLFLLTVLLGCFVALLQYSGRSGGFTATDARQWIQGNENQLDAELLIPPKSSVEILAIIHDHVFSLAMLLFVVLHLVELTPWSEGPKIALSLLGYGSLALTLFAPWWLQQQEHGTESLTPLMMMLSGSSLLLVLSLGSIACLDELWCAPIRRKRRKQPDPAAPSPLYPGQGVRSGSCPMGHQDPHSSTEADL
ncbi:MAG: hypothetical protein OSB09_07590 [Planctomycetota bacterium]|nr:hypothetical protein [Planctomycetota bacterium]